MYDGGDQILIELPGSAGLFFFLARKIRATLFSPR